MKKSGVIIIVLVLVLLLSASAVSIDRLGKRSLIEVDSFVSCIEAGFPILESYPRQCKTPEGETFIESVPGVDEGYPLVTSPLPGDTVSRSFRVTGSAPGYWFFEASFPIRVLNEDGEEVALYIATALEDWMTMEYVHFEAEIFLPENMPSGNTTLVLSKDNPSGLSELDRSMSIQVILGEE